MKTTACFIALVALAAMAQKPTTESPLHSMVATERAFSQASADKGTRDSFLMFIADDGILFRPSAVSGKKWLQEHPVPLVDNRPLLSWQPIFADVAALDHVVVNVGRGGVDQERDGPCRRTDDGVLRDLG